MSACVGGFDAGCAVAEICGLQSFHPKSRANWVCTAGRLHWISSVRDGLWSSAPVPATSSLHIQHSRIPSHDILLHLRYTSQLELLWTWLANPLQIVLRLPRDVTGSDSVRHVSYICSVPWLMWKAQWLESGYRSVKDTVDFLTGRQQQSIPVPLPLPSPPQSHHHPICVESESRGEVGLNYKRD